MIASMLSIVAIGFIVTGLLIGLGAGVRRIATPTRGQSLAASFWVGWASWIGLLQLLHLGVAMGSPWVLAVFAGLGGAGLVWDGSDLYRTLRATVRERRLLLLGLVVFGAWLSNRGLGPLLSIDAGLYHLGSIRWASDAPLVEGLGNLHGRLAFNSTAFLWLSSLDRWPSLFRGFNIAPGLLLLAAVAQVSHRIPARLRAIDGSSRAERFRVSIFHLSLLLPLLYASAVMHVSSTSPDWIVLILGVVLASELGELFARDPVDDPWDRFLTIAALCAAGITVKLSFAALGVTAVAVAAMRVARPDSEFRIDTARTLAPGFALALLLLVPWSLRSVELSGYPAYPSTVGALEVAWKIPEERVVSEVRWIRSWARAPGKTPDEVLGNTDWLLPWMANRLRASDSIALLVFPTVLIALGALGCVLGRGLSVPTTASLLTPYAVAVLAWFVTAPDPRFLGSALWICAGALLAANPAREVLPDRAPRSRRILSGTAALCGVGFLAFIGYMGSTVGGAFISPGPLQGRYPLRTVETKPFRTESGLILHVPINGDQCWEAPLPCTPYPAPRLGLRNEHAPYGGFELR